MVHDGVAVRRLEERWVGLVGVDVRNGERLATEVGGLKFRGQVDSQLLAEAVVPDRRHRQIVSELAGIDGYGVLVLVDLQADE